MLPDFIVPYLENLEDFARPYLKELEDRNVNLAYVGGAAGTIFPATFQKPF